MRILQATTIIRYGAGIAFTDLCCELSKRGHEVHAASTTHPDSPEWPHLRERLLAHNVELHRVELFKRDPTSLWASSHTLMELMQRHRFDAWHAHAGTPAFALWTAQEKAGIEIPKKAGSLHGFGSHERPEWMDVMDRFAWSKCDFLSTDSHACIKTAIKKRITPTAAVYPAARFEEKSNHLSEKDKAIVDSLSTNQTKIVFTCVSEVIPGKGQRDLALAAKRLAKNSNRSIACILIGAASDPEYARKLQEISDSEPLLNIIFAGQKDRTRPLIDISTACVFPTYAEGLGLGIIESIATEIPTYFSLLQDSTIDIVNEIELDSERFTFAPGNVDQIYEKLQSLLDSPIDPEELARYAKAAQETFSIKRFTDGFENFFIS